ncbi:efflux RND transporter periplasmic adaptor subunit [Armatimonas rosea]|uniref:RND family efflux transporter MFP subunit n=1 Tax=Armatimonas rosea TaxID=685828 RepID=A0A7W9SUW8_ARMRO|nr:efflux RND transporter periplasmic adaptor subunit [Armatimonas rosea]MBB6052674.1 RND family efflux transporter MFP subunit [Armatimonas rosea]
MMLRNERLLGALALVNLGLGLASGCARSTAQAPPSPLGGIPVESITAQLQLSQAKVQLSGQVEPYRIATVSSEVAARLTALPITVGARVGVGGLLAQLDSGVATATLHEAEAGLRQSRAARSQAEAEYARAVVETAAAQQAAHAQLAQAEAGEKGATAQATQAAEGERKARSATRAQELLQAVAALAQAQADDRLATKERDRVAVLLSEGVVGQQALDRAQAAQEAAAARKSAAEQGLSLAREGARDEDIRSAAAGVAQASAGVASFQAQKDAARAQLRVAATRPARLESIRRQIEGLKAQEARAAASVEQARLLVLKHRVVAPFAGRVLAKLTESGQTLAPGSPIARLGELSRVKAVFAVPEAARLALRPGQRVPLTADALPGKRFTGVIETVGYQADPRTRAFAVEVRVENPQEALLPNMVVRLALDAAPTTTKAVFIPLSAVATDGSRSYVFLLKSGKAQRKDIVTGPVQGERVLVQAGLVGGETLAATPQRLTDGVAVAARAEVTK